MSVEITEHFDKRFTQRIAKSKRMSQFVSRALYFGKSVNEIKNSELRKELLSRQEEYGATAKVYNNSVYWFDKNTAITVYPVPQKYHGRI